MMKKALMVTLAGLGVLGACRRQLPRLSPAPSFGQPDLAGRAWIADFIYTTCPGPCPVLTANMSRLQSALPASVRLVSFTVDPRRDTPEVLADYAKRFGADPPRWRFVRLDEGTLSRVMVQGFRLALESGGRITHSTKFVLVDAQGQVRGYYDGDDEPSLKRLTADAADLVR